MSSDSIICGISGRNSSVSTVSIRVISRRSSIWSSRTRLLASTISAGSMYTVFPEADSSWTIPEIRRLYIGGTGMTRRPSRIDGVTSLSIYPASTAFDMTRLIMEAMAPDVDDSCERISRNSGEALSRMLPNRSIILSIDFTVSGNEAIFIPVSSRCG